jgi:flagellar basal-body rod protein FlgG
MAGQKLLITSTGEIFAGETRMGALALAEFPDATRLNKTTSTLYTNIAPENVPSISKNTRVRQGFIESSNVNPVNELVELLKANRTFESNMKAIKSYNDMAGKEANEVGKL